MDDDESVDEQQPMPEVPPPGGFEDEITRGQIAQATQHTDLPLPPSTPHELPFGQLDPGVFERLVTEIVTRRDNRGAHFYGRSGQKQWGLDIVEHRVDTQRELYQVRRLQAISPTEIRAAVTDYAGAPRADGDGIPPRRFDPRSFTIVTTAPFDNDTANVDELNDLRARYSGDLDLAVWGAEEVARVLRNEPYIVAAYFSPEWAKAWCGADVTLPASSGPAALAFVESPFEVLGLTTLRTEATDLEATDPERSADLFRALAGELDRNGFPGHASTVRRSQARALRSAGSPAAALEILTDLAVAELIARTAEGHSLARDEIADIASQLGPGAGARSDAINVVAVWHEEVCDFATLVPALQALSDANDRWTAPLVCLALEQAIVDGWYEHQPAESPFTRGLENPDPLLKQLCELARQLDATDPFIRARLRTAVADADLSWDSSADDVEAAFRDVLSDANAGRFLSARGLVTSRAAFAFASRGAFERADGLWRQAAIYASEHGYYGDVRNVLRASQRLIMDQGQFPLSQMEIIRALPNRDRLLAGAYDPALIAYEQAHNGKVREAFGDGRRYLWESRISGHWAEWLLAARLMGNVLVEAQHVPNAVQVLVAAGLGEEAESAVQRVGGYVDILRWLDSPLPRVQAAAIRAVRAQIPLLPEHLDESVQATLSAIAPSIWTSGSNPHPGHSAVQALITFRSRLGSAVVDSAIELTGPARTQPTRANDALASLIMQLYGAVPDRRTELAAVVRDLLLLEPPPDNLWTILETVPEEMRAELTGLVEELASLGRPPALATLAAWGVPNDTAQVMARLACASLLRNPVGTHRETLFVTSQARATVDLLIYLNGLDEHYSVPAARLAPAHRFVAGGTFMHVQFGPSTPPPPVPGTPTEPPLPAPTPPAPSAAEAAVLMEPDDVAHVAAGGLGQLVRAVALHLAAVGEDGLDYGPERVNALSALHDLVSFLDAPTASDIGRRMFELHHHPRLGEIDAFAESTNNPLSRGRFNMGADRLAPYALMIAAACYQRVHELDPALLHDPDAVERAVAAAMALLASPAEDLQNIGANTLAALSGSSPHTELVLGLIGHPNEHVRALGAHEITPSPPLLEVFARDAAPTVRTAAAEHPDLLSEATRASLTLDPHLGVRRAIAVALGGNEPVEDD